MMEPETWVTMMHCKTCPHDGYRIPDDCADIRKKKGTVPAPTGSGSNTNISNQSYHTNGENTIGSI